MHGNTELNENNDNDLAEEYNVLHRQNYIWFSNEVFVNLNDIYRYQNTSLLTDEDWPCYLITCHKNIWQIPYTFVTNVGSLYGLFTYVGRNKWDTIEMDISQLKNRYTNKEVKCYDWLVVHGKVNI